MKLRTRVMIFVGGILASLGLVATVWLVAATAQRDQAATDRGHARLAQAVGEMLAQDPRLNRPCFGTAPLKKYSYQELATVPMTELKAMLKKDPGICPE